MSEAEVLPDPEDEVDDVETEEDEGDVEGTEDPDDEEPDRAAKPAVDWQKRAHDKEGQAAKERSRRRAAERTVADLTERLDRLETQTKKTGQTRREQLIASLREDVDEPLTDLDQLKAIARTLLEEEREQAELEERQTQQTTYINKLTRQMVDCETDFRADHKDYDKACDFYKASRTEDLEELGYTGDRLIQRLSREMYGLVDDSLKAGRDPAEAVYKLAKRAGFGTDEATRKLQKLQSAGKAAAAPRGQGVNGSRVTYDMVTKATGPARDKLWAKLRAQERGGVKA